MKKILLSTLVITFCFIFCAPISAQVVSTIPVVPIHNKAVTITFDASKGSAGLAGYTGTVYAHAGVITNLSSTDADWKYVKSAWGENLPELQLAHLSGDIWQFSLTPSIRAFFGVPASEQIQRIALVFRSGEPEVPTNPLGFIEGKDDGWRDIFIDVSESDFNVIILSPTTNSLFVEGSTIPISVACDDLAKLSIAINGVWKDSIAADTLLNYSFENAPIGEYTITAKAQNQAGTTTKFYESTFVVRGTTEQIALPANLEDGINYYNNDPTKVTLVLRAPWKDHIFVVGDFNDWKLGLNYMMKVNNFTADDNGSNPKKFWLTIENLIPGKEYKFQYFVDDSIWTTDPYCEVVYNASEDPWVQENSYPYIPQFPNGASIYSYVGAFRTAKADYNWISSGIPAPNTDQLAIYELCLRDFMKDFGFQQLIDTLDYLQRLGINAIEFMPVTEFDGNESWGYNPAFYFAIDKNYGTQNYWKKCVDECHRRGITVIMDVVFNHTFGNSPTAKMWWDGVNNVTRPNNPYHFNFHTFGWSVGNQLNHSSPHTQYLVKRALSWYLNEYHVDGFRFDMTKGFLTYNAGNDADNYNLDRINIIDGYKNHIRTIKSDAIVILEHFTHEDEENDLMSRGMLCWDQPSSGLAQLAMGFSGGSNIQGIKHNKKIVYMSSHDQERPAYKVRTWGHSYAGYNCKDTTIMPRRMAMAATLLFGTPGPKMLYQFEEIGYDYPKNRCWADSLDGFGIHTWAGTENEECNTNKKPIRWDYLQQAARKQCYEDFCKMIYFHTHYPALANPTEYYIGSNCGDGQGNESFTQYVHVKKATDECFAFVNADVVPQTVKVCNLSNGKFYELFSGDSINVTNNDWWFVNVPAGEHRIYSKNKVTIPAVVAPAKLYTEIQLTVHSDTNLYVIGDILSLTINALRSDELQIILNDEVIATSTNDNWNYTINKITKQGNNVLIAKSVNAYGEEIKVYRFRANRPELIIESPDLDEEIILENGDNLHIIASIKEADNLVLAIDSDEVHSATGNHLDYSIQNVFCGQSQDCEATLSVTANSQYYLSITKIIPFKIKSGVVEIDFSRNITIYPNPVNDVLNVQCAMCNVQCVEILDINGKMLIKIPVANKNQVSINTSTLTKGNFILKITTDKGIVSHKIVK